MKNYAADLREDEDLVKHQKFVENFYKEQYEKKLKIIESQNQQLKLTVANQKNNIVVQTEKINQLQSEKKSLSDQNNHLKEKIKTLEEQNKQLSEEMSNMVPLISSTKSNNKPKRQIDFE